LTAKVSYTGILQSALKQQQQHAAAPASSQHDVATIATMRYVAPEVLRLGGYALRPESDVYAFGIVMWEAYAGQGAYRKLLDAAHLYEVGAV
jgi:serine/threonine protein kinase